MNKVIILLCRVNVWKHLHKFWGRIYVFGQQHTV